MLVELNVCIMVLKRNKCDDATLINDAVQAGEQEEKVHCQAGRMPSLRVFSVQTSHGLGIRKLVTPRLRAS